MHGAAVAAVELAAVELVVVVVVVVGRVQRGCQAAAQK